MNIALTGDSLLEKHGNGRYARGLLGSLLGRESDLDWHVLYYQDRSLSRIASAMALECKLLALPPKRLTRFINLITPISTLNFLPEINIVHALRPTEVMNLRGKAKQIVTLLDLGSALVYRNAKFINHLSLSKMKDRADLIIAISNTVRDEAIEQMRIEPDRVVAIPLGIDEEFFNSDIVTEVPNLPSHYIVAIGHNSPHKNIARLIEAHTILKQRQNDFPALVLTGSIPRELGANQYVMQLGYVLEAQLRAIIQRAELLVFPSISEGFGFPPLEAQALGVPTAVSDIPVLRESLVNTSFYFDPLSVESIAFTLEQAVYSSARREEMRITGKANAERFRWKEVASRYIALYRQLI